MVSIHDLNLKRDVSYTFRLPESLREAVKKYSEENGKSVTDVIVEGLQKYVAIRVADDMYTKLDEYLAPALKNITTWKEFIEKKPLEYMEKIREVRSAIIFAQSIISEDAKNSDEFYKRLNHIERLIEGRYEDQLKRMGLVVPPKSRQINTGSKTRRSRK